jgi:hypothetical protein
MISFLAASLAVLAPANDKVDLVRVFKATDKATFDFVSRMQLDSRQYPVETFIPETDTFLSTFTVQVEKMKPDGVADVRFKRPKLTLRLGETFSSAPKDMVLAKDQNILFTLSRRNQILGVKDETPKPKTDKKPKDEPPPLRSLNGTGLPLNQLDIGGWMSQLHQLAGFVNFFDLGPILPNHPVAVGESWKETVGYAPTTVSAGADKGKNINARIDYVMTFRGKDTYNGKPVWKIEGLIKHETDAAPYIADMMGIKLERAPFKEIKLKMDGGVTYFLDISTLEPVRVEATSVGEASITVLEIAGPVYEEKFKSRATLTRK